MLDLAHVRARQDGVVARGQLLDVGVTPAGLRRLLRRRELVVVHPGVYASHTGPMTQRQRAWAAVLALWPAGVSHESAVRLAAGAEPGEPVHVAVDRSRSPQAPSGVVLHHVSRLDERVLWAAGPPRVRVEHAVLDVAASAASDLRAMVAIADAVQGRLTTAGRLRVTLDARPRIARREVIEAALAAAGQGAHSMLEHDYLTLVERPHGLPRGRRQVRAGRRWRDVEYDEQSVVVELDGRLFHDSARARDDDLERDLDALVDGRSTLRLGWGQVHDRPCRTAAKVAALLQARGWRGQLRRCGRCAEAPYAGVTG